MSDRRAAAGGSSGGITRRTPARKPVTESGHVLAITRGTQPAEANFPTAISRAAGGVWGGIADGVAGSGYGNGVL